MVYSIEMVKRLIDGFDGPHVWVSDRGPPVTGRETGKKVSVNLPGGG
jgi:hypothetical protein